MLGGSLTRRTSQNKDSESYVALATIKLIIDTTFPLTQADSLISVLRSQCGWQHCQRLGKLESLVSLTRELQWIRGCLALVWQCSPRPAASDVKRIDLLESSSANIRIYSSCAANRVRRNQRIEGEELCGAAHIVGARHTYDTGCACTPARRERKDGGGAQLGAMHVGWAGNEK